MRRTLIPAAVLALALLAVPGLAQAKPRTLKVMTQNLYLGADLTPLVAAKNQNQFEKAEEKIAKTVDQTNFPARAKALARLIDKDHPALIGLQEVALWRKGPKNDPAPATTVVYDFLKSLQGELKARGLRYRAARIQTEADAELPAVNDDRRLTMRDVILQDRDRKGLKLTGSNSGHFKTQLQVPLLSKTVQFTRGWAYVNAKFNGVKFRFVDTHLESFVPATRAAQAQELVAKKGPANAKGNVILVGDLNSDVSGRGGNDSAAIGTLLNFGFKDTWTQVRGNDPGLTCCHPENDKGSKPFDSRIDYVLTKPRLKAKTASVVGTSPADQAEGGLWPSDHAGRVTGFKIGK
jgi:hypothetical protein